MSGVCDLFCVFCVSLAEYDIEFVLVLVDSLLFETLDVPVDWAVAGVVDCDEDTMVESKIDPLDMPDIC